MRNGAVQTIAQRSKEEQEQVAADMLQQREEWDWKRRMKVKRERGWSGNTWGGLSVGPPDPGPNGGSGGLVCLPLVEDVSSYSVSENNFIVYLSV